MSAAPSLTPSIVRTLVPVVVGAALTALLRLGIDVPEGAATEVVTVALTLGYYAAVRFVEDKHPQAGWLLGLAKAPAYSKQDPPQAAPLLAEVDEQEGSTQVHNIADEQLGVGVEGTPVQTDNRPSDGDGAQLPEKLATAGQRWSGSVMR